MPLWQPVTIEGQAVHCIRTHFTMATVLESAFIHAQECSEALGGDCKGAPLGSRPPSPTLGGVNMSTLADPTEISEVRLHTFHYWDVILLYTGN